MDPAIVSMGHPMPTVVTLQQLIEPYSKEELSELLLEASITNSQFHKRMVHMLHHDKKWCKLFVHGLSYQTTNTTLHEFYSLFGVVKEAVVLVDKKGHSKGYGFVTFTTRAAAIAATKVERRPIDNRMTHCSLAFEGNPRKMDSTRDVTFATTGGSMTRDVTFDTTISEARTLSGNVIVNNDPSRADRRLFVHSLAWKTDHVTLRKAFAPFGEIEEAIVVRDKKTHKSKGYGFVVFTMAAAAGRALEQPGKIIDDRETKCNLACERPAHTGAGAGSVSISASASPTIAATVDCSTPHPDAVFSTAIGPTSPHADMMFTTPYGPTPGGGRLTPMMPMQPHAGPLLMQLPSLIQRRQPSFVPLHMPLPPMTRIPSHIPMSTTGSSLSSLSGVAPGQNFHLMNAFTPNFAPSCSSAETSFSPGFMMSSTVSGSSVRPQMVGIYPQMRRQMFRPLSELSLPTTREEPPQSSQKPRTKIIAAVRKNFQSLRETPSSQLGDVRDDELLTQDDGSDGGFSQGSAPMTQGSTHSLEFDDP